jgi:hypothetical protein
MRLAGSIDLIGIRTRRLRLVASRSVAILLYPRFLEIIRCRSCVFGEFYNRTKFQGRSARAQMAATCLPIRLGGGGGGASVHVLRVQWRVIHATCITPSGSAPQK